MTEGEVHEKLNRIYAWHRVNVIMYTHRVFVGLDHGIEAVYFDADGYQSVAVGAGETLDAAYSDFINSLRRNSYLDGKLNLENA